MSAPDTDPTCPGEPDADCSHAFGTVGDGIGRNLVINANLIMGNAAEAGSGGGIRFQGVNGIGSGHVPHRLRRVGTRVNVTNNIIANNVAGWDGGGVSLQDSLAVNLINNTIVVQRFHRVVGDALRRLLCSIRQARQRPAHVTRQVPTFPACRCRTPQPAGRLERRAHSGVPGLSPGERSPVRQGIGTTNTTGNRITALAGRVSNPILYNDVLWQNRAFNIVVTQPDFRSPAGYASRWFRSSIRSHRRLRSPPVRLYWDIGLRGDTGPTNHLRASRSRRTHRC